MIPESWVLRSQASPPQGTLTGFEPVRAFLNLMELTANWGWNLELITAPYCTSWGAWRAEVRHEGQNIAVHYDTDDAGITGWHLMLG